MKTLSMATILIALLLLAGVVAFGNAETLRSTDVSVVEVVSYSKSSSCTTLSSKINSAKHCWNGCFQCSASSPSEYAQVAGTVVKAIFKGVREAVTSGVKAVVVSASTIFSNLSVIGKLVF
ncbi:MAG: hypothetical protein GTO29_04740 [Candidatus Latescibacteria bacterium]|nr:hypothetical protein [Candidatus Latescibacterota bacterium]NIO55393.1 hypothetical protein [Candidatus Latescibacterota bacterium]